MGSGISYSLSDAGFFHLLGSIDWSGLFHWSRAGPVTQWTPQLPFANAMAFDQFQQLMGMQFEISEIKRRMLTMPPLPTEGF
ncbi:hypothetical protein JQ599_14375 [Bradyrhizobium diazoefficiens]|nr:hypothetical protein [Bradyrhizobium diazoefficiens]MBR0701090.1 hypothetical protein [Bradyrhizobium diazoefficiens]MBR0769515.1 hypothetical protein [Bradyrhizobium diazoefficiens]